MTIRPKARRQLDRIWRFIAARDPVAADRVVRRLLDKIDLAADHPQIGSPRPDVAPACRILIEGRYIVLYQPIDGGIDIVAVVHGMRDPSNWFV